MKVGEAKFGSSKKFFKFEDGDNVYRILPALGELAEKGIWSQYYKVCWGYKNSEDRIKLFQDCRETNRQTKMVEVESAAYQRIEALKAKQAELKEQGADKETMDKMVALLMRFNIEGKHYVNAVNLNGEIGLLKIGHKAKMALDALVKKQREEEGQNILSVSEGLYVNFGRTGRGRDTLYQVSLYKKKVEAEVNGQKRIIEEPVFHNMDDKFQSRLDAEAFELGNMFPAPTSDEVYEIVNGGPAALDAVMEKYKKTPVVKTEAPAAPVPTTPPPAQEQTPMEALKTSAGVAPEQTPAAPTPTPAAPVETAAADGPATPTEAPAAPVANSALSDDDFLNMIETGNM
jgi:hypothetical protein